MAPQAIRSQFLRSLDVVHQHLVVMREKIQFNREPLMSSRQTLSVTRALLTRVEQQLPRKRVVQSEIEGGRMTDKKRQAESYCIRAEELRTLAEMDEHINTRDRSCPDEWCRSCG